MSSEWYRRTISNHNKNAEEIFTQEEEVINYKDKYRSLKRKLKFLIYENECFQEALRSTQRQLLKANRDKSYLLDRLLRFEKVDASFTESEDTDSSEDEMLKGEVFKRRKVDVDVATQSPSHLSTTTRSLSSRKKKPLLKSARVVATSALHSNDEPTPTFLSDGHMTPEEVERHLESRQSYLELVPEKAPPTVPTEMFSNDTSLDKLD